MLLKHLEFSWAVIFCCIRVIRLCTIPSSNSAYASLRDPKHISKNFYASTWEDILRINWSLLVRDVARLEFMFWYFFGQVRLLTVHMGMSQKCNPKSNHQNFHWKNTNGIWNQKSYGLFFLRTCPISVPVHAASSRQASAFNGSNGRRKTCETTERDSKGCTAERPC